MMLGEVVTGLYQVESHMTIYEGDKTSFVENWLRVELAVINRDNPETDIVFSVPVSRLRLAHHFQRRMAFRRGSTQLHEEFRL